MMVRLTNMMVPPMHVRSPQPGRVRDAYQYFTSETMTAATAASAATIVHRAADCAPAAAALAAPADSSAAFRARSKRSRSADSPSRRRRWCCSSSHSQAYALPVPKCSDSSLACTTSSPSFSHSRRTSSRLSVLIPQRALAALPSIVGAPRIGKGAQRLEKDDEVGLLPRGEG